MLTTFAVIGDMAETSGFDSVAAMIKSWNPAHIISAGDNNNNDDADLEGTVGRQFHSYISPYLGDEGPGSTTGNRFWPVLGNHDWDGGVSNYTSYFTLPGNERYYNVRLGEVEFFMLDSDPREPSGTSPTSTQGTWLRNSLAASTAAWQVVVFHHAAYSSADAPDNTWMRWPFKEWGADVAFSGHDHLYERLNVNGMPFFTNGVGGANIVSFGTTDPNSQFRYNATHGAIRMEASDAQLVFQLFNKNGTLIDSYTLNGTSQPPPTIPVAPSGLAAAAVSATQVALTWQDNSSNESGFRVERSLNGSSGWTEIGTAASAGGSGSYTDSGRTAGTTYFYRVRAYNAAGNSGYTNTANATPSAPVVLVPTGSTWKYLDNGSNQGTAWRSPVFADTSWSSGAAQLGYGDGDESTVVSYGTSSTNKHVTTYFRKGFNVSNPSAVTALNLRLLRDDGAVVYLNGTEVFRSNMPTGTIGYTTFASAAIEPDGYVTASINPALLVSGNNVIAVEIHQSDRSSSDVSFDLALEAISSAPPPAAPSAPTGLGATAAGHARVDLSWGDASGNETGFRIERSTGGGAFVEVATVAAGVTAYADTAVTPSTAYAYRVRAYNDGGNSGYSNTASATTAAAPPGSPSAPSALGATASGPNRIDLSWIDTVSNEQGFNVYRSTNGGTTWSAIGTAPANASGYADTTVAAVTQYWYRVRAFNDVGESMDSSTATATTPAVNALPAPWSNADVGGVGVAGSATHSNGTFTVKGAGRDIWGAADGFNFVFQTLSGDGSIVARVTGVENVNSGAHAGVMIRDSLSSDARHASMVLTATGGIGFVRRTGTGSTSAVTTAAGAIPYWLKLTRAGNTLTGFRSTDGVNWTQMGAAVTITMNPSVYIGLVVCSKNTAVLNTSTFTNVSVITSATAAARDTAQPMTLAPKNSTFTTTATTTAKRDLLDLLA
ncbi:MAG TPA: fibronectin type III domain-containing protein [Tepidisphaeraceae bacterium]|nr:fibronectin type III domain-containing protein [Tepidisphaeraceae bacterium]